nr:hypothetical protein [Tanacetum cinerariifolium]
MSTPKFATTHNLIVFLEKPSESDGFEQIVDFIIANPIKYALTASPTIYTFCIKQFWTTVKIKTVNDDVRLQVLIDGKKVVVNEASIRYDLKLNDAKGTSCLSNAIIFKELARMGYEKPSEKLTFYKAFFSPQWKFLIHNILQCFSAKTTSWNEFSSTMASAIICLANNQKFNFSKYIHTSLVKNLEAGVPFYMFPREHKPRRKQRMKTKVFPTETNTEEHVHTPSNDLLPSGEDRMQLKELMKLCTNLSNKVPDLENEDDVTLAQTLVEIKAAKTRNAFDKKDQIALDKEVARRLEVEWPIFEMEYNKVQAYLKKGPGMDEERIKAPRKRKRNEKVEKDQPVKKQKGDEIEQDNAKKQKLEEQEEAEELKRIWR